MRKVEVPKAVPRMREPQAKNKLGAGCGRSWPSLEGSPWISSSFEGCTSSTLCRAVSAELLLRDYTESFLLDETRRESGASHPGSSDFRASGLQAEASLQLSQMDRVSCAYAGILRRGVLPGESVKGQNFALWIWKGPEIPSPFPCWHCDK